MGVKSIFATWALLEMAIDHQFGGRETLTKVRTLYEDLMDLYYDKKNTMHHVEVAEFIEDYITEELRIEYPDGTYEIRQVAQLIHRLYADCASGNYEQLNAILTKNASKSTEDKIWGGLKPTQYI